MAWGLLGGDMLRKSNVETANSLAVTATFTGGDGNNNGYRLIGQVSISEWANYRCVMLVKSRHQGSGLITITIGNNSATITQALAYAEIKYWGPDDSGVAITDDAYQVYVSADGKTGYLFWKYTDYSPTFAYVINSDFALNNGTWMSSIGSEYGSRKAYTQYNAARSATWAANANYASVAGAVTFATIGDVATSNKITWNGSTDGADIYYETKAADQGNLVINLRDDYNCYLRIAQNGNYKSYFSPADGNFHGNVNGTADYAGVAARLGDSGNVNDPITFYDTGRDDKSPTWFWGSWGDGYAYRYHTNLLNVNYANSAGYATTAGSATNSNVVIGDGYMRIGAIQICHGTYRQSGTIIYNQAFVNVYSIFLSCGGYVGWRGPYVHDVSTTSFYAVADDERPIVYWMAIGTWQ